MKRIVLLATAAAVALVPVTAAAAKKPVATKRSVVWSYAGPFGAYATGVGGGGAACATACYTLKTTGYERHVSFSGVDATGGKVGIQWYLNGKYANVPTVCNTGGFDIAPGTVVSFDTVVTPSCAGVPTSGKVTITVTGRK